MEEKILDYLPVKGKSESNFWRIYKNINRFFVFNFWFFSLAYGTYLARVYYHLGYIPLPWSPDYVSLSQLFVGHQILIFASILLIFFAFVFWPIINLINFFAILDAKIFNRDFQFPIDFLLVGLIGFIISFGLFFSFNYSVKNWYMFDF